eukprot:TRINITY_DN120_c0_g1_i1.p1 TRINITY_DN120_c0_g1~~TRINITY_DN120_c0_g1_i1.p1  ORF type:complete len:540 (+),score=155.52 TRINITY_DN120_c0_g1_i1:150-1622(+)
MSEVQKSMEDFGRFNKIVQLKSFLPFPSAESALENINCVSEGILPELLKTFLETNLSTKKKTKVTLGVGDEKLGGAINEGVGIQCTKNKQILELLRWVRAHFTKFVKELKDDYVKAQLGLGHSYSRAKVKFNVNRSDNMIIQSINLLDTLDKDINTFSMRVKEWYSWHFPELVKVIPDNYIFAKVVRVLKNRANISPKDIVADLEKVTMDATKAQEIVDASSSSMGTDISDLDMMNICMFAERVIKLTEYRAQLQDYLKSRMHEIAPNLSSLIGEQVGARLISHAGSLVNLAKYPASTVQILGAEKALFRALKTRGNTPKYGLIFHSSFIGKASTKNKGRISRYLANKCSIASRIDAFSDTPTVAFGNRLHEQIEERLNFYDNGKVPRKNLDVMKEAMAEVDSEKPAEAAKPAKAAAMETDDDTPKKAKKGKKDKKEKKKEKKQKKKSNKKRKRDEMKETEEPKEDANKSIDSSKKSKKKQKKKRRKSAH